MANNITVIQGSGNFFADLGFDNPEEEQLKAQLVREIREKLADMLGLKQPDVSAIINGRTGKFSIERLLRCIRRLDREVSIVVTRPKTAPKPRAARLSLLSS